MTSKEMRESIISEGKEMPDDFWNYLVNPIVGYYIKPISKPIK